MSLHYQVPGIGQKSVRRVVDGEEIWVPADMRYGLNSYPLPSLREVLRRVANWHGAMPDDLIERNVQFKRARRELMWVLRHRGMSYGQIAMFCKRHHTTCITAWRTTEDDSSKRRKALYMERNA